MRESGTSAWPDAPLVKLEIVRDAVTVVLRDVDAVVGPDAVTIIVGTPEQLSIELEVRGFHHPSDPQLAGWAFPSGGGATGIWIPDHETWNELIARVADVIQEAISEGARHWGTPFPPCPRHRAHPMNAQIVDGVASWVCPREPEVIVPVGGLQPDR